MQNPPSLHPNPKLTDMPAKLQLSIHQPCHENWQHMTPSEQGRFCQACAKEVIDFTSMSDTEVLNYFLKEKRENVCGRLYQDQMHRDIQKPKYTNKKFAWYWNYLVMFFLFLFKSNMGKAQVQIKPITLQQAFGNDTLKSLAVGGISAGIPAKKIISGRVMDENKQPIAGAAVQVKGKSFTTITDAKRQL